MACSNQNSAAMEVAAPAGGEGRRAAGRRHHDMEDGTPHQNPEPQPDTGMLQVGQPVLRVGQGGALLDGVIIDVERGGAALLVAIACRGRLAGVSNGARSAATSYRYAPAACSCSV